MPDPRNLFPSSTSPFPAEPDLLGELGRATTAYHEAPPERLEVARQEYERILIRFKTHNAHSVGEESD